MLAERPGVPVILIYFFSFRSPFIHDIYVYIFLSTSFGKIAIS